MRVLFVSAMGIGHAPWRRRRHDDRLEAGVPQLVLPNGADRYLNADAVAGRGVGISSSLDELDAALIGELLAGDTFRRAAAEVRAEIRARPAPSTVVDRMVELAGDS